MADFSDFGDFGDSAASFPEATDGASFGDWGSFGASDAVPSDTSTENLSAEALEAAGLDMDWAAKLGISSMNEEATPVSLTGSASDLPALTTDFSSLDFSSGAVGGEASEAADDFRSMASDLPSEAGTSGSALDGTSTAADASFAAFDSFGSFGGAEAKEGEGGDAVVGLSPSPSSATDMNQDAKAALSSEAAPTASLDFGSFDEERAKGADTQGDFGSFGSDKLDAPSVSGVGDVGKAFGSLNGAADAPAAFGDFGASTLAGESGAADAADAGFASFDSTEANAADEGDFGDFGSGKMKVVEETVEAEGGEDSGFASFGSESGEGAAGFGNFGDAGGFGDFDKPAPNEADGFGNFGATSEKPTDASGGFGDFSTPAHGEGDGGFGDFESDAPEAGTGDGFGDFGATSEAGGAANFGDFGAFDGGDSTAAPADFGAFDNSSGQASDSFGDFGGSADLSAGSGFAAFGQSNASHGLGGMDDATFRKEMEGLLAKVFQPLAERRKTAPSTETVLSLRDLLTAAKQGGGRCKRCNSATFPSSHTCLTCGNILVQHTIQDQWTDQHVTKKRFAQAMYIPEVKASHHNPLQPSAPGQVIPVAEPVLEPMSPMQPSAPLVATSLDPAEPSIPLNPEPLVSMAATPPAAKRAPSTPQKLTDFDLSVFGEIAPSKQASGGQSNASDFDSFLLGFDSTSTLGAGEETVTSIASINEKIEQQGKRSGNKKKGKAAELTTVESEDAELPANNKKLMDLMSKIPDLTFMTSPTLVVPASKYNFSLSST